MNAELQKTLLGNTLYLNVDVVERGYNELCNIYSLFDVTLYN